MRAHRSILAAAVVSAIAPSVRAQGPSPDGTEAESQLKQEMRWLNAESQVTIATGISQPVYRAPAIATVITAEDIEAMGITELDEALETVPGLHVSRNGFQGYGAIYTIRGIYADFNPEMLLLINGIPVTAAVTGGRGPVWGGMSVNNIARIEVIRGPGSAVYGADAFSGVINVITKTSDDIDGTEAGVRVGSFDSREVWALHGGKWQGFDVALALEYFTTDGHKEVIDEDFQSALDHAFNTDATLAPGPVSLSVDRFDARLDVSRGEWSAGLAYQGRHNWGDGVGSTQILDPNARFGYDRIIADVTYHDPVFTDEWDVTAQASFLDTGWNTEEDQVLFPRDSAFAAGAPEGFIGNTATTEYHYRLNVSGIYSGFDGHQVRLGVGMHYADLRDVFDERNVDPATGIAFPAGVRVEYSDTPHVWLQKADRTNRNLIAQDSWAFAPGWDLTTGVRYDDYSDFGSTVNPRLALAWQTSPKLTTKVLYGRAFRAPSFVELYSASNPVTMGNPNLDPEIINTVEIGFNYRAASNLNLALNLFKYAIDDKIQFVLNDETADDPGDRLAQNIGKQKGKGLELETQWRVSHALDLAANYAYQESVDEELDEDAGNAPHHQWFVRADWRFNDEWSLNTRVKYIAGRERLSGDPRPNIDDYSIVDMTLRRKGVLGHWDFAVAARNLLDADAREPTPGPNPTTGGLIGVPGDLPLAGRSFFTEARYRF